MEKKVTGFALDIEIFEKLKSEKNKSKLVNDLLTDYYNYNEKDDSIKLKLDEIKDLINFNINCSISAMLNIKSIRPILLNKKEAAEAKKRIKKILKEDLMDFEKKYPS